MGDLLRRFFPQVQSQGEKESGKQKPWGPPLSMDGAFVFQQENRVPEVRNQNKKSDDLNGSPDSLD